MFENDAIKLSSFVEGQTRSLKGTSFLIGVAYCATSGWIIRTGNQGAPRDCDQHMSPLLCTAYTSANSQYTPLAPCFFGERGCSHSPEVHPTLRQAQGPLVGVCAFSSSLYGFRLVPAKRRCLVPPGCRACRDTPAGTPQNCRFATCGAGRKPLGG